MEEIRSAFLSNQETLCSLIPQEDVVLWFQLLKKLLNFKRFEELFGLCWSQRSSDCPFNGMLVAVDHAVPQVMMVPQSPEDDRSRSALHLLDSSFCSSWPGLLQFGLRLGESCRYVRGHQHHCQTGPLGPSPAPQMHHHALRLCRNVSTP